ncbi:MAG: hypothetical protein GX842_00385 [Spirochaetales bacterium]|nr:hypothetical protein [Spirochaetales bacterium]
MELSGTSFPLGSKEARQAVRLVKILKGAKLTTGALGLALECDEATLLPQLIDLELNGVVEYKKGEGWQLRQELSC